MGKFVFTSAYLAIDSTAASNVNLSDHVRSITLNYSRAEVDATCMTDDGIARLAGLRDWSMDVEFAQDFGSSKVDKVIYGLMSSTLSSATVWFSPTTGTVSATNPRYKGEGMIFEYPIASGAPGDLAVTSVTIMGVSNSSQSGVYLHRAVA